MDIIHQCLSLAPISYLAPAFSILRFIFSSVEQAQASKQQLRALAQTIAQLLCTLNEEYHAGRLVEAKTSTSVANLDRLLNEISIFVQKEASRPFLTLLFTKGQRIAQIEQYHGRISTAVTSFQISALVSIQAWQARNDDARAVDQRALDERLAHLETSHQQLMQTLNVHPRNSMAMMVSLEKRLQTGSDDDREHQFFAHTLRYLTTTSGRQVEKEDWMITPYEVEFGCEIGSGGFGQVFEGSWNKTRVALKVLMMEDGITPSSQSIRNEIKIWANLRHPNILQFLGANVLDNKPFIVMPYLQNGNARDYLREHPNGDRLQILYDISLGLVHLHSHNIIHGDLKALNVLIDDSGKAVLCDFGLSRVKADVTSRTAKLDGGNTAGSRNWMAPERLLGGSLKRPCDIYAFGMTLYEIFADEIPLSELNFSEFIELVVRQDVRPERPDDEDAPQLSDAIWKIAENCWMKNAKERPTAAAVCATLSHLLHAAPLNRKGQEDSQRPLGQSTSTAWPTLDNSFRLSTSPVNLIIPPHLIRIPQTQEAPPRLLFESTSIVRPLSPPSTPLNLTIQGHTDTVWCAAFSPDGKQIVSGSKDGTIWVWGAQTGKPLLGPLKMHTQGVCSVVFSPNGTQIASGSFDSAILVWNAATGEVIAKGHTSSIASLCFSPDGEQIASASWDKTIRIWNARTGALLVGLLSGHTRKLTSVTFSGDGTKIVSGSFDKTIRVRDAKSGRLVRGPMVHNDRVRFVAFSPDSKRIVSASQYDVCVWNADTGTLVSGPSVQHAEDSLAVAFTPKNTYSSVSSDGKWIAALDKNSRTVHVWNSKTGQVAASFEGHAGFIGSISFSPDSKRILTTFHDKTIHVHTLEC